MKKPKLYRCDYYNMGTRENRCYEQCQGCERLENGSIESQITSDIYKSQRTHEAILQDYEINELLKRKAQFLSKIIPVYILDKVEKTLTTKLSDEDIAILDKIDLLVKARTDKIVDFMKTVH
jgi:hypothetical protein